ncbi:MAG TPA: alternative ribosome rescue aminoacyl-tRNA hydrolase ArfB [Vicinamibacterales bacterium]|nr:alternative ribosome rescue aminoacyl-tRNA hydrolase ArfB [Vicinamibacterales bacterium]
MIAITPTLFLEDQEVEERFVRASGPGGQNVNKVATAVELRFDIWRSSLPDEVKQRLAKLAGKRLTDEGVLLIDSREHRRQARNREAARERLAALIRRASVAPVRRRPTKVSRSAKECRLTTKKRRAVVKAARGRPPGDD